MMVYYNETIRFFIPCSKTINSKFNIYHLKLNKTVDSYRYSSLLITKK